MASLVSHPVRVSTIKLHHPQRLYDELPMYGSTSQESDSQHFCQKHKSVKAYVFFRNQVFGYLSFRIYGENVSSDMQVTQIAFNPRHIAFFSMTPHVVFSIATRDDPVSCQYMTVQFKDQTCNNFVRGKIQSKHMSTTRIKCSVACPYYIWWACIPSHIIHSYKMRQWSSRYTEGK